MSKSRFVLENEKLSVGFDEYGRISSFKAKEKGLDFFTQKSKFMGTLLAGLRIRDELKFEDFCELWTTPEAVEAEKGDNSLVFRKTFREADFKVEETFSLEMDHLYWHVRLFRTEGEERTVQIRFMLPFPEFWSFWAPCDGTPFVLDGMKSFRFTYPYGSRRDLDGRIAIPMATVYDSRIDVGLSLVEPFELPKPGVSFVYESSETDIHYGIRDTVYYEESRRMPYVQIVNLNLRLREDGETQAGLMLVSHEGGWRPGLGWVYNRYREYFDPGLKDAHEHVGMFMSGFRPTKETEEAIERITTRYGRILWEIHGYFPFYGLFVPEKEPWDSLGKFEQHPYVKVGFEDLRDLIRMLHKYGAHAYIYWENREGLKDWVLENFSDSLVKTEKGELVPAWRGELPSEEGGTYLLNPDLRYSWGRHCLDQARKELETYPELDGIFVDGYREMEIDFGHDDGVTMVHNKPVYNWNFAYHPIMEKVSEMCHSRGKGLFANKPVTVETQKYLDILMVESGEQSYLINIAYMGLNKPLAWIAWFGRGKHDLSKQEGRWDYMRDLEHKLKLCLKWGAFPQMPALQQYMREKGWEEGLQLEDNLYRAYMKLIEMLRSRKWVFTVRPVAFSHGLDGNIFQSPSGDLLVPLVVYRKSLFEEGEGLREHFVRVGLAETAKAETAELHLLGEDEPLKLSIEVAEPQGSALIRIPRMKAAAMLKIQIKK